MSLRPGSIPMRMFFQSKAFLSWSSRLVFQSMQSIRSLSGSDSDFSGGIGSMVTFFNRTLQPTPSVLIWKSKHFLAVFEILKFLYQFVSLSRRNWDIGVLVKDARAS